MCPSQANAPKDIADAISNMKTESSCVFCFNRVGVYSTLFPKSSLPLSVVVVKAEVVAMSAKLFRISHMLIWINKHAKKADEKKMIQFQYKYLTFIKRHDNGDGGEI